MDSSSPEVKRASGDRSEVSTQTLHNTIVLYFALTGPWVAILDWYSTGNDW